MPAVTDLVSNQTFVRSAWHEGADRSDGLAGPASALLAVSRRAGEQYQRADWWWSSNDATRANGYEGLRRGVHPTEW